MTNELALRQPYQLQPGVLRGEEEQSGDDSQECMLHDVLPPAVPRLPAVAPRREGWWQKLFGSR